DRTVTGVQTCALPILISVPVAPFGWADFAHVGDLIAVGEEAARRALPDVKARLARANGLAEALRRLGERALGRLVAPEGPVPIQIGRASCRERVSREV